MAEINIIGAGITGLAAAVRILSESPRTKVRIYEAGDRVGGRLKPLTVKEWGKSVANPHLIAAANAAALKYLETIGADIKKNKAAWRTTSFNPFSLYRLFTESTQNIPFANADKKLAAALFFKAAAHGMTFYHAEPDDFIDRAVGFIKENQGKIILNRKINSVKEFSGQSPLLVCVDAYNMKRLGLLSGELKPLPIVNVHFDRDVLRQTHETVLCPDFAFPCVIFAGEDTVSVTVSAAAKLTAYDNENIIRIFKKLLLSLYEEGFTRAKVFKNVRATVKVAAGRFALPDNVIAAGDFMSDSLPATIESAVTAGNAAADKALDLL